MNGLRNKPLWVNVMSLFLLVNTFGMPIQIIILYGHSPFEWTAIWAKLTLLNKMVMILSPIAALGLQRVCPCGWYAIMAFLFVSIFNNIILLQFPTPIPKYLIVLATLVLTEICAWFVSPKVKKLFHQVELHWWKPAKRYCFSVPVELATADGKKVQGKVANISHTGLLIESVSKHVNHGDLVTICITFEKRIIRGIASVVRHARESAIYPYGLGLKFTRLSLTDRIWLYLRLPEIGTT